RMNRATPNPHAPLRRNAPIRIAACHPPANGSPFMGNTTNSATALGPRAPSISAHNQYCEEERAVLSTNHNRIPHRPPQKASEITCGTCSGEVGSNEYGARVVAPEAYKTVKTP